MKPIKISTKERIKIHKAYNPTLSAFELLEVINRYKAQGYEEKDIEFHFYSTGPNDYNLELIASRLANEEEAAVILEDRRQYFIKALLYYESHVWPAAIQKRQSQAKKIMESAGHSHYVQELQDEIANFEAAITHIESLPIQDLLLSELVLLFDKVRQTWNTEEEGRPLTVRTLERANALAALDAG